MGMGVQHMQGWGRLWQQGVLGVRRRGHQWLMEFWLLLQILLRRLSSEKGSLPLILWHHQAATLKMIQVCWNRKIPSLHLHDLWFLTYYGEYHVTQYLQIRVLIAQVDEKYSFTDPQKIKFIHIGHVIFKKYQSCSFDSSKCQQHFLTNDCSSFRKNVLCQKVRIEKAFEKISTQHPTRGLLFSYVCQICWYIRVCPISVIVLAMRST